MSLINRISEVIKDNRINDKTFCERVGIKPSRFSNYKSGVGSIPAELLIKIVQEFEVRADWLLTGHGDMYDTGTSQYDIKERLETLEEEVRELKRTVDYISGKDFPENRYK